MIQKSFLLSYFFVILTFGLVQAAPPGDFTSLVTDAGPAVVNINTEKTVQSRSRGPFLFPSPFEDFFRGMPNNDMFDRYNQQPRQKKQHSLGSGFLISPDGYIVTNHHVIDGADSIRVSFDGKDGNERSYKAQLIGSDPLTDLALLKIDEKNLPYLKFGSSNNVKVGEWVLAIGNPFGLDHTVTAGIISAKGRSIRSNPFDSFLQTDASINPGNSGGPLLNMNGEVIGINAAIIANGQGIGFAIPSDMAKEVITTLRTDRKVSRGWIGVTIQSLDENTAKALGLSSAKGALIGDVMPDNPADKAGMKPGDVIMSVNGEIINDSSDLSRKIAGIKPNEKAVIIVWRNGGKKELTVTMAERDTETARVSSSDGNGKNNPIDKMLGMSVRAVTSEDAGKLRLDVPKGLLITGVERDSVAEEANLRPGDVILGANGVAVNSVESFTKILNDQGRKRGAIMLYLYRQGNKFFRTLTIANQ